jgi:hypothetical protein
MNAYELLIILWNGGKYHVNLFLKKIIRLTTVKNSFI